MNTLLLDTNILLDVFLQRQPFFSASARIFASIEQQHSKGVVSAISLTTIDYILTKHKSSVPSREVIRRLMSIFEIGAVDSLVIQQAMDSSFIDFEDAVLYFSSLQHDTTHVITRNGQDFSFAQIPVMTLEQFLSLSF
jgi:predicted nucleic acid-binding protein